MCSTGLVEGARNLLLNCAELGSGQRVVVIAEHHSLGWYDEMTPRAVANEAGNLGASVELITTGAPGDGLPSGAETAIRNGDVAIFFSRIGDQDRFEPRSSDQVVVMSYARTAEALGSGFGRLDHRAMLELKARVDDELQAAHTIEMRCPSGTKISADTAQSGGQETGEVTVRRFPMGVPQPIGARAFRGRVALPSYLTPTGSRSYEPPVLVLNEKDPKGKENVTFAEIHDGRIQRFCGTADVVAKIEAHYAHVAELFGIDAMAVHSWHAGLHPGCHFDRPQHEDPDLWSNTVFNSPTFAHFHTCGAYAPGEISWMVQNPTILLDGRPLWNDGRLEAAAFPSLAHVLSKWPCLAEALAAPYPHNGPASPPIDP